MIEIIQMTTKRMGTLVVSPDEEWELQNHPEFLCATPTKGPIPDGFIGILPLPVKGFHTFVCVGGNDMGLMTPKPQGRGIVKALGQKGTTGRFKEIEAAEGKGAAIASLQNKLAKRRGQPVPFKGQKK